MTEQELQRAAVLLAELARRKEGRFIDTIFPEKGPYRRELYQKHMEFFAAGIDYRIRVFMAANQIGKTSTGGLYEVVLHCTGDYPLFWPGIVYDKASDWWCAGETLDDARKVLQERLLGKVGEFGSGLIPRECLDFDTMKDVQKDGVLIKSFRVKHKPTNTWSTIALKSYDQGRKVFQGLPANILLDEEPPIDIMVECLTRTVTGSKDKPLMLMMTYTPLKGMSDTVKQLFGGTKIRYGDIGNGTYVVNATWDDVPHISEESKQLMLANYPAHQRLARSAGVPTLTEGAIYGIPTERFVIPSFEPPAYWPRVAGLDVGWNRTACIWWAHDRDNGEWHLYREHYVGKQLPSEHADSIRAKGEWIPICIDPASRGRSQRDGEQLMENYKDFGLRVEKANNAREAGIEQFLAGLAGGKIKVHDTCVSWIDEYNRYSRDKNGVIIKVDDHAMDASRYGYTTHSEYSTGRDRAITKQEYESRNAPVDIDYGYNTTNQNPDSWMSR